MPSLRIEIAGQVVTARLSDAAVRVGREPTSDLRIDDAAVSAAHCTIEPLPGGGHKLTDLNSGRPTKVNGLVVKRVSLKPGDVIEVGPARITYLAGDAVAPAATAPAPAAAVAPAPPRPVPAAVAARPAVAPAAAPAPVPARAVAPAAVPAAPVPVVPSPAAAAASPAAPAADAAPVAPARRARAASPGSKLKGALVATAVFAVAALGIAAWIRSGGGSGGDDLRALRTELDRATALEGDDVDRALEALDRLAQSPVEGIRRSASREAAYVRERVRRADSDVADLERRAGRLEPHVVAAELGMIRERYGAAILAKHRDVVARLDGARGAFVATRTKETGERSAALLASGKFAEALTLWDTFVADLPGNDEARRLADDGRLAVEGAASEGFKRLAGEAEQLAGKDGPRAAAMLLRARLPDFVGTSGATAIALRAADYDHAAVVASSATARATPAPASSPSATAPRTGPAATPASAPSTPAPSAVDRQRLSALLTDADALAAQRKFREALAALAQAGSFAAGGPDGARVAARRDDLELAHRGVTLLNDTIRQHPDRFTAVELSPRYVVSLVEGDEEFLSAAVRGGRTKVRWATLDGARVQAIVALARPAPADALPLAALLRECGSPEGAERELLRAVEGGADKAAIDARLARWRGEAVPAGGYVAFEGRLVSPAERDRLVLLARVAAACAKVGSPQARERKAAYEELLGLGAPAKEAFLTALRARREAAAKEVATSKVFTSGRTRQHLLDELEKRRAAALALIEDEKEYPYPYAPDQAERQKRVDDLVDRVREVWERPFDLVASWDKAVEESLALVREVDEVLGKVEEGYVPDLDAVKATVNRAIDVPGANFDPYDKDVLAFNEKVATSATPQEKENVRIVNRYRMMMGRRAVKIEERLVRGARGHSIEMRVLKYFAHESPTPGLESPGKRCAREGYSGGVSENIAWGTGLMSAQGAFDGWFHSSGHHRNMLGKGWTELGVGRSCAPDSASYWTQNFGALGGKSLGTPDALPPPRADVAPEKDPEDAGAAAGGDAPKTTPDDGGTGGS
ncbi:MAG: FHA domain-containing protein [Planctomycetes bacterium]|nr:FHA domain-containing protein [Planctomycetota bacterium]